MKRWILGAMLAAAGCRSAPSTDQCKLLLEHLIDLEFKKAGATGSDSTKAEIAKQKQAVTDAKANDFVEFCANKTAKIRVECALAANDLDAVTRCDETK